MKARDMIRDKEQEDAEMEQIQQSSLTEDAPTQASSLFDMDKFCTDSFMQGEKLKQIPFYSRGSYFCAPCAKYCRMEC